MAKCSTSKASLQQKDYLREHEVTDEEMEDIVLRESVGTCIRCGDPLFRATSPGMLTSASNAMKTSMPSSKAEIRDDRKEDLFMEINRGDVFYVNRSETIGSEQRSGRPAIIVSIQSAMSTALWSRSCT